MVFGARAGELPEPAGSTPLRALEDEIRRALLREPCLVSFSGGRDSSSVLAVATALARREGLPLPIPATNVFPAERETDETYWQERLVRHLGLADWLRIEHTVELDAVGIYARRFLSRHGLHWPFNVHFHAPLLEAAAGGALLTGIGGDELFAAAELDRVAAVTTRRVRPEPRDLLRIGLAYAPPPLRRAVLTRREPVSLPWLRREGQQRLSEVLAEWMARAPRSLSGRLTWVRMSRYLEVATAGFARAAEDEDVLLLHPLLAPALWAEVGRVAEPIGFSDRTAAMRRLFGGVLPDEICGRVCKARFDGAFWTTRARTHAESWTGGGVPAEWVDEQALATHWRGDRPLANSFTLLQASWLASAQSVDQPVHGLVG
ncbi:MAG TPA: asparagine synthase-related protein [Solirubrobacteraceae bacterium]|nr:asparagine synthase-related protein [Solirubrobacteraceae bacterium]